MKSTAQGMESRVFKRLCTMTDGKDTYQDKHLFLRFIKVTSPHCTPETDFFFLEKELKKKKRTTRDTF